MSSARRSRGDGGLRWDERKQRWIAYVTIGYDGRGKRIVRRAHSRTKTEAQKRLRDLLRAQQDGIQPEADRYTVEDWLAYGLGKQGKSTVANYRNIADTNIIPLLGRANSRI